MTETYAITRDGALTQDEARELTDRVKQDALGLWRDLVALYAGNAHRALGYRSWAVYCQVEFELGRSPAYRMLNAGRVMDELASGPRAESPNGGARLPLADSTLGLAINGGVQSPIGDSLPLPRSEAVARELAPALRNGHVHESWEDTLDQFGPEPTAAQVRQVVRGQGQEPSRERCPTCGQLR